MDYRRLRRACRGGLALLLHTRLFRTAGRRGWNPLAAWDGRLSVAGAVAAGPLVLLGPVGVWLTHRPGGGERRQPRLADV